MKTALVTFTFSKKISKKKKGIARGFQKRSQKIVPFGLSSLISFSSLLVSALLRLFLEDLTDASLLSDVSVFLLFCGFGVF